MNTGDLCRIINTAESDGKLCLILSAHLYGPGDPADYDIMIGDREVIRVNSYFLELVTPAEYSLGRQDETLAYF